jgi:xylan 1,4-beta-xylosidase
MYARMGTQEVAFASSSSRDPLAHADSIGGDVGPDVSGFAALSGSKSLQILIYDHHDDWDLSGEQQIELEIANLPFGETGIMLHHYRIDRTHSNAYAEWVRQGRPMYPTPGQYAAMKGRDDLELLEPPRRAMLLDGKVKLTFTMPTHSISLLVVTAGCLASGV